MADAGGADEVSRNEMAGSGRRHLGGARWAAAVHPFENDGVAGLRSRGEAGQGVQLCRGGKPEALAENSRRNSRPGLRARLQLKEESVYPVLWFGRTGCEP